MLNPCNYPVQSSTPQREWEEDKRNCCYCREPNHTVCLCSSWRQNLSTQAETVGTLEMPRTHAVSPPQVINNQCFTVKVQIRYSEYVIVLTALIHSGTAGNFINQDTNSCVQNCSISSFIEKKGGGLRPCLDLSWSQPHHGEISLCSAIGTFSFITNVKCKISIKLDLCSAYSLVCISEGDEWKWFLALLVDTISIV